MVYENVEDKGKDRKVLREGEWESVENKGKVLKKMLKV